MPGLRGFHTEPKAEHPSILFYFFILIYESLCVIDLLEVTIMQESSELLA